MKKIVALASMVVLLFPVGVSAEKIILAALEDYPPFQYRKDGVLTGIDLEIAEEVCGRLGLETEFRALSWKRYLQGAKRGKITVLPGVYHSEEQSEFLHFTSAPMYISRMALFARKGSGMTIYGISDLKGRKVAVHAEVTYGPEFDNYKEMKKEVCYDNMSMVKMLEKGRVDLATEEEIVFRFLSRQIGFQDRFEMVYTISDVKFYMGVSKKALGERGKEMADKFSKTLILLRDEGFIRKVFDKYR